ncbi:hypothetical protein DFH08DRAFT_969937 [Mycena albidolilacea]|uniref:Uncharacterized protein n=1 Tax=Mycena albidolilacea TaxID=1033008 RepID=A0AAD7EHA9_9AGAR|nr:hypothetical protein DFH08DRAFT_969937 [Mycena albidolilacea]
MVKETLGGLQEDLYDDASALFAVAETLDHVDLMNLNLEDDDDMDELAQMLSRGQSDTAAILRMYGALFIEEAESLKGDGMRGPYFQVQKSEDWFVCALNMPDREFRAIFRISRLTFDIFCEILEQNPLFLSRGRKPQHHIAWQLGAFLIRYGQLGSPVQDTSFKLGIGFGTVILYCRRVIRAVHELKPQYARWFSEEHQLTTSAKIEAKIGFPNCVGSSDGSLFQTVE